MRPALSLRAEQRDAWLGVYWQMRTETADVERDRARRVRTLDVYACALPFLPLRIRFERSWWKVRPGSPLDPHVWTKFIKDMPLPRFVPMFPTAYSDTHEVLTWDWHENRDVTMFSAQAIQDALDRRWAPYRQEPTQ